MAYSVALKNEVDVVVASEPNKKLIFGSKWFADKDGDVAILLINRQIVVKKIYKGPGMVVLQLEKVAVVGCYISPNITMKVYNLKIDELSQVIDEIKGEVILAGDFNAKSAEWGAPKEDQRGEILAEMASQRALTPLNTGAPTFVRRGITSHIDITFATPNLVKKLESWEVLEEESLSPHKHILIKINQTTLKKSNNQKRNNSGQRKTR